MFKKYLLLLLTGLTLSLAGCGGSETPDSTVENDTIAIEETDKENLDENATQDEDAVKDTDTENPLMAAELYVEDVLNGNGTEKIGEYAYIVINNDLIETLTMEQYDEFCDEIVADSGYNWVSIRFYNGTGLVFQGSIPSVATYGKLDTSNRIEEVIGTVMSTEENVYEYTPSE